jgi:hypothetical protein
MDVGYERLSGDAVRQARYGRRRICRRRSQPYRLSENLGASRRGRRPLRTHEGSDSDQREVIMTSRIAVINAGSSSEKFAIYEATSEERCLFRGRIEGIGVAPRLTIANANRLRLASRLFGSSAISASLAAARGSGSKGGRSCCARFLSSDRMTCRSPETAPRAHRRLRRQGSYGKRADRWSLCPHAGFDCGAGRRNGGGRRDRCGHKGLCCPLMTIPGVGQLTALAFVAAIELKAGS